MQPVVRALRLLTALAQQRSALTLQELADLQGLPVSTVHRLTSVLQAEGYLIRSDRGKLYSLGPAVRGLVTATSSDLVQRVADPVTRQLNVETDETVIMVELIGNEAVCFARREGRRSLRMYVELGSRLPLHAAASARVLLADLPETEARALLASHVPLQTWTERTLTDVDQVMEHIRVVRDRGYDTCDVEMEDKTWAVGAPIKDSSGATVAAIALTVPEVRAERHEQQEALRLATVRAAAEISAELGCPPPSTDQSHSDRGVEPAT